jgi:diaminohydroxyphosphoribosylaminopyrimidine deaminase/5-amino-6-(5-phosphoribosylamino)uracil reductase
LAAGVRRVVVGAVDPNPRHSGRAFGILRKAGIIVDHGILAAACTRLNESFNHWITRGTPFVTVKAAMTLDGKIATPSGESRWVTSTRARAHGMRLRQGADAVLVGVNTVLADDPSLTVRDPKTEERRQRTEDGRPKTAKSVRRIVLDSQGRTPLTSKVVCDEQAASTTIAITRRAPARRVAALRRRVRVLVAPEREGRVDLPWLMRRLGREGVTSLLVEGGGEVNASFLRSRIAQRVAFFYAPKILGGHNSRKAVAGVGARNLAEILPLRDLEWRRFGDDLFLTARVG